MKCRECKQVLEVDLGAARTTEGSAPFTRDKWRAVLKVDEWLREEFRPGDRVKLTVELNASPRQGDEADLSWIEGLVRRGCELVESAICHVSHGGPTIAEAKAWLDQAKIWLKERQSSDGK